MTGGAGADRFVQESASSTTSTGTTTVAGLVTGIIYGSGVDIVTDFNALQGDILNAEALKDTTIRASGDIIGIKNNNILLFQGDYSGSTFVFSATGADLLYGSAKVTTSGSGGAQSFTFTGMGDTSIVLVGGAANFDTASNFVNLVV